MKSIVISSNCSGGGKTTISIGLMKVLKNRGYDVQGYKVGPDYIDTAFHTRITGKASRNLDLFLTGEAGMKACYSRGTGDFGIVEGAMGLYDGIGIDTEGSAAHIARTLNLPVLLVLSPTAQVATLCAEINGLMAFENVNIIGVVLNNISESYFKLLKATIELNCNIKVLGYLPKDKSLNLSSRHLGLIQSQEIDDLEDRIEHCSKLMEQYINIDAILEEMKEVPEFEDNFHYKNIGLRSAVPYDKAFSFYYKENLEALAELGEVVYFSPLKDAKLPENIDFLYIGGGYPEIYAKELSENTSMLTSIKQALNNGLNCYAECGGLMYLTDAIEKHKMVGFFNGNTTLTKSLQNFGYCQIEIENQEGHFPKNLKINCHEFHTSFVELSEAKQYSITKTQYNGEILKWEDGYFKNNTLAGYPHVHFFGNMEFLKQIIGVKYR